MVQKNEIIIISNTGPLISFLCIDKLEILKEMFNQVIIPIEVFKEFKNKEQKAILQKHINHGWMKQEHSPTLNIIHTLGAGEASVISLGLQHENTILLLDDLEARRFAESLGLTVSGTLGILAFAKELKLIKAIKPVLDDLKNQGRYISPNLYKTTLKLAGEV